MAPRPGKERIMIPKTIPLMLHVHFYLLQCLAVGAFAFCPRLFGRLLTCLDRRPVTLDRPSRLPDKEIFEYIRAYLSVFQVYLKNIQKICAVCPARKGRNEQDCPPTRPLGPPDNLRMPSMTIMILPNKLAVLGCRIVFWIGQFVVIKDKCLK
jgi:hypothetical protein